MSIYMKSRIPPAPPPKPKNYSIGGPLCAATQIINRPQTTALAESGARRIGIPPGDSDTDSGICLDSDSQISPDHTKQENSEITKSYQNRSAFPLSYGLRHYKDSGDETLDKQYSAAGSTASQEHLIRQRRLPQQSGSSAITVADSDTSRSDRSIRRFRVRFADEVPTLGCSSASSNALQYKPTASSYSKGYLDQEILSARNFETDGVMRQRCKTRLDDYEGAAYRVHADEMSSLPPPPRYSTYFDSAKPHKGYDFPPKQAPLRTARYSQGRSSSLPRGTYQTDPDDRWVSADFTGPSIGIEYTLTGLENRRMLPEAPIDASGRVRQPANSRQKRAKRGQVGHRSHSIGPSSWKGRDELSEQFSRLEQRGNLPAVRAKLVALDHRGFRTVTIEKMKTGPFGFYIATGIMNQRRGIFISRVSLPSLIPVLSVGDELIYVENQLVAGCTLERVQSLIAGKNSVTLVLLPNSSCALC